MLVDDDSVTKCYVYVMMTIVSVVACSLSWGLGLGNDELLRGCGLLDEQNE